MPSPDYIGGDYDAFEPPRTPIEILGRGSGSRRSKTYLKSAEVASLLGHIRGHVKRMEETFRRLHAAHYTVKIEREEPDGTITRHEIPEILSAAEIRDRYPIVAEWERLHEEQVEHYASIEGFTVRAVSGLGDEDRTSRKDSSAGADDRGKAAKSTDADTRWR